MYYAGSTIILTFLQFLKVKFCRLRDRGFKNLTFDSEFPNTVYSTAHKIQTRCLSHQDLCNLYIGPKVNFAYFYTSLTVITIGTLNNDKALLYPMVSCYFFICFWMNKYLIIYFYRNQDEHLIQDPSVCLIAGIILSIAIQLLTENLDLVEMIVKGSLLSIYCLFWLVKLLRKPLIKDDDQ